MTATVIEMRGRDRRLVSVEVTAHNPRSSARYLTGKPHVYWDDRQHRWAYLKVTLFQMKYDTAAELDAAYVEVQRLNHRAAMYVRKRNYVRSK